MEFGAVDVHVRALRNTQEFDDPDDLAADLGISDAQWSLFGVLWGAGRVLATLMSDYDVGDRRVLEVGCGLGLASLVLTQRACNITATDLHPEAGAFLQANAALNGHAEVPFLRAGWNDLHDDLGTFDLIIGSDVLYERGHSDLLAAFIDRHARPACDVVVVDPGRHHTGEFRRCMADRGYTAVPPTHPPDRADPDTFEVIRLHRDAT